MNLPKYLAALLLLLQPLLADEFPRVVLSGRVNWAASAPAVTYLVNQNFEGTGYDNSETWTEVASPNEDYTTSPAPLVGSQSLYIPGIADAAYIDFTAQDEVYAYCQFNLAGSFVDAPFVFYLRNGSTDVMRVGVVVTGAVRIYGTSGAQYTSTSGLVSLGTTYHLWVHFKNGTGSNAVMEAWLSTTGTKGSAVASGSSDASTAQVSRVMIKTAVATATMVTDRVLVSTSSIGDNP